MPLPDPSCHRAMIVFMPLYLPAMLGGRFFSGNLTCLGIESRIMSAQCCDELRYRSIACDFAEGSQSCLVPGAVRRLSNWSAWTRLLLGTDPAPTPPINVPLRS